VRKNLEFEGNRISILLPVSSMVAVVSMLASSSRIARDLLSFRNINSFALILCPFALLGSALLLRRHTHLGYILAAVGAVLPLPWIFMTESRGFGNSWISMNASWNYPDTFRYMRYSQLRIISVALLLATLIWAVTRLLPSHWQLRNRPLNRRTWPAMVITLVFIVWWFATFAFPYRQPLIVDAVQPELSILQVKKNGIAFHETRVSVYRSGRYYIVRNNRRLFQYSFVETVDEGFLTGGLRTKLEAVQALPALKRRLDQTPRTLRARHGEGWYVEMSNFAINTFTTEDATSPPADLQSFFREVEGAPSIGAHSQHEVRDVCLGFCYDPKAGLGYRAENQRCREQPDGREHCY